MKLIFSNSEIPHLWAHKTQQAEAYLVEQNKTGIVARYDEEKDAFIVTFEAFEGEQEQPDIFEAETIQVDGEPLKVYAIGSGCWVWEEADA